MGDSVAVSTEKSTTKSDRPSVWRGSGTLAVERGRVLLAVLVDAIFLAGVALVNWAASLALEPLHLSGVDQFVFLALQWMLGVSTLGISLAFLVRDLWSAFRRAVKR
jgi:hypothetical protein